MKRIIGIIIITVFLVAICTLEEILINSTLNEVKQYSKTLYELSQKSDTVATEEIISLTNELNDYWLEREPILCFFINYKDVGEMGNEITRMKSYTLSDIKEEFDASLTLVLYYCETFNHITGLSVQNIF